MFQFIMDRAAAAYPEPVRAADLRRDYERQYGMKVHDKTFGMTLYRASQLDIPLMRRTGRADWFYIPPEQRGLSEPDKYPAFDPDEEAHGGLC